MRRLFFVAAVVALVGCGARSGLVAPDVGVVDASVVRDVHVPPDGLDVPIIRDVTIVDVNNARPCEFPPNADFAPDATICEAMLHVGPVSRSSSTCFVDQMVENTTGSLRYECDGGFATARFGTTRFVGSLRNGQLWLCASTEFVFNDGCHWRSAQEIRGRLAGRSLLFTYSETHADGETGCAPACSANAIVTTR